MKSPLTLLRLYLGQMWVHLSVVRQSSQQQLPRSNNVVPYDSNVESRSINRTYLLTFILFSILSIHGIIGLHWESGLPLTSLREGNLIFWRQFFPKSVWPQVDIVIAMPTLCAIVLLLDYALKQVPCQYLFTINRAEGTVKLAGKDVSNYESSKLISMYRRMRLTYKVFWSILFTFALLYDYAMVFLVIKVYTVSFWSLSYWIVEFPFALAITLLFTFANLVHIIIGGSCIQTRQQYICQNFSQLLTKLLLQQRPSVRRFKRISFQYRTFNHSVLSICQQLQAFNSFYTHYLSLIFTEYNVMQGLFAYPVFFASSSQSGIFMLKWLFSVTLFEMIVFLFGIIQFCARVVKKNGQVTRMNRQFAVHCLRNQQLYRLPTQQLLKLELLQWPRLLPFYAFKLFDNTRITSQTFYVMAGNISGFFFFVAQNIQ